MKIAVIGAGYVGLTTAACLAKWGHSVDCLDVDKARILFLQNGGIPIVEPGLEEIVRETTRDDRLRFSSRVRSRVGRADIVFLAVGTPSREDGDIDLSFIRVAAESIAAHVRSGATVVIKSSVVVGTGGRVREWIRACRGTFDVHIASNPEFLREGSAIGDFMSPDRIVIGADDPVALARLRQLYEPLTRCGTPLLATTTRNAELVKYTANAFLALKIGFINDVATLCEQADGDIAAVAQGIGLDSRIGSNFLAPGPGFGGSCFPKDTRAFVAAGRKMGAPQVLIETLIERNESRKMDLFRRVITEAGLQSGDPVAIFGLAFKANTDDVRESPGIHMATLLRQAGLDVRAHDPQAGKSAASCLEGVTLASSPYEAARGARTAIIMTEWNDYRILDVGRLSRLLTGEVVFDYRNVLDPAAARAAGLRYVSLGRPALAAQPKARQGERRFVALDKAAAAVWQADR